MTDDPFAAHAAGSILTDDRGRRAPRLKQALAPIVALMLSGCAATTPPPRFSPVSPADPTAPEAAIPGPSPALTGSADVADAPAAAAAAEPMQGHEGHSMPGMDMPETTASPTPPAHEGRAPSDQPRAETYTCLMHPQIAAKVPGSCPICGMKLVKKKAGQPGAQNP
jgi:hypothetical protein